MDLLSELLGVSVLQFYLISEAIQMFLMNFSVVLHLFLQRSLQNTCGAHSQFYGGGGLTGLIQTDQ